METVIVDVQTELGLQLDGLNEHDVPVGRLVHESATGVAAPFTRVNVAVAEALDICFTVPEDGDIAMEKSIVVPEQAEFQVHVPVVHELHVPLDWHVWVLPVQRFGPEHMFEHARVSPTE